MLRWSGMEHGVVQKEQVSDWLHLDAELLLSAPSRHGSQIEFGMRE